MNQQLKQLHPYPFQKLRNLLGDYTTAPGVINLSIGEPKHETPSLIIDELVHHLTGLARYPTTLGSKALREAIATWLSRRYGLPELDVETQILPVNGSREALFSFAQSVVSEAAHTPVVICPNPFYQIYEGAAILARAEPYYLNTLPENGYRLEFSQVPVSVWQRTQLVYLCSPNNPTGTVMDMPDWREIFALSDQYGFVIASDECYSEIYLDEDHPPLGALQAAQQLRRSYERLVVFGSLSKRSNVPGMRSGFVAGDAAILKQYLLYRTYHGCAMSPVVQAASAAAWRDEAHVVVNRMLYRQKFDQVVPVLQQKFQVSRPKAAFYLWMPVPGDDVQFCRDLYQQQKVVVLPGSFLARTAHGVNPGAGFVRVALVSPLDECLMAVERLLNIR